MQKSC